MTCVSRSSPLCKIAPFILTQPNSRQYFNSPGTNQMLPLSKQATDSWKATEPQNTLHFIVEVDNHNSKPANYSSQRTLGTVKNIRKIVAFIYPKLVLDRKTAMISLPIIMSSIQNTEQYTPFF